MRMNASRRLRTTLTDNNFDTQVEILMGKMELLLSATSLYNLTNDEVPVLVHFGSDRQESRTLIRLKQPEGQGQEQ